MNQLIITIDKEDYCLGLTGTFNSNGFSGFGEGWFNNDDVLKFCSDIQSLVKSMNGTVELIGSQHKSDGSDYLETFSLRCYVLSASKLNGIIGVHVTLAEHPSTDCRKQEVFKMSGELQVRNHKLGEFAQNLRELVIFNSSHVTLNGDLNDI